MYILRTYDVVNHKFRFFYHILICLFFMRLLTIHLLISLGTLLARENTGNGLIFFEFGMQISAFLVFRLGFLQIQSSHLLHLKLLASSESIIFYFPLLINICIIHV